jgi:Ca2+-binding RTX toxin-like protein
LLKGGTGDDTLIGGRGKDRFIDGAGSDMVKGGGGFDVFVLRGAQAKYDVTQENADTWLVTRGADTDTLIDIEMIRFADDALIF